MRSNPMLSRRLAAAISLCVGMAAVPITAVSHGQAGTTTPTGASVDHGTLNLPLDGGRLTVAFIAPNVVRVHYLPDGKAGAPSLVIDPRASLTPLANVKVDDDAEAITLGTGRATLRWHRHDGTLQLSDADGRTLLTQGQLADLARGRLLLDHARGDALYGIGGYNATEDASAGMLRQGKQVITAGEQGHAGAPLVWSTAGYGVLIDTIGGAFHLEGDTLSATGTSRKDLDYYLIAGTPAQIFTGVAQVSGHSQLFPKWAMGFTNSQWGIDQKELLQTVDTYRSKHIPIDNFTLDFDWKAWGEDWGEFRWNTSKFPDGPDGRLERMLDARGMHLTGIMKPRVHVDTVEGRYATAHGFWSPASKVAPDYFSKKPIRELDFDQPAVRAWFFNDQLKHSFDTGMVGWWNDEADDIGSDTQFTNMERALYDGQRAYSPLRVWSINRTFYLGAQRYAYGMWSGDIPTGFPSMAGQRARMLSAVNVGAMQWGMDGGGFKDGTPTPENYARWIEFGAFTPIFRVHGSFGQKRQPWVYGPVAEKAATDAIRLRYALIPYIYSYEYRRHVDGVGLVRPLIFDWPHDPKVRNDTDSWLFGDYLLVSPVVRQGQTRKDVYLPAGQWTDWFSGKVYQGGQSVGLAVDSSHWSDIPLFIRDGAIIPTQPPEDYVGQKPLVQLEVEVFPAARRSTFDYYDDDGSTYGYEHGACFMQALAVQRQARSVQFDIGKAGGTFRPALRFYLLKIHGTAATKVTADGALKFFDSLAALEHDGEGWARGNDRFGAVTYVRVSAATARHIALTWGR
ncbi:TIM-barrel domain-containing protein [Rhodanobacter ginsengisoli]|uniref:TIM-barrel domain-containing protein n=1 Tax=Rhodanobacter ginsengisoli TaxID=418646 RepID=A0ABW0QKQ7_9GAMM